MLPLTVRDDVQVPQTPRHVLRDRILTILASIDAGRMTRADLLAQLEADFQGKWTREDLEINQRQGGQTKWRINASFARKERYRLRPPGELRDLYTDIFDHTDNCLYEAKATATRDAVRMALGQLLDYSRHVPDSPTLAILLPAEPSTDMQSLLRIHGIRCVHETTTGVFAGV